MAMGLRIFDTDGVTPILDTTDRLLRLLHTEYVDHSASGSKSLPELNGKTSLEFAICGCDNSRLDGGNPGLFYPYAGKFAHHVYRTGNIVYWEPHPLDGDFHNVQSNVYFEVGGLNIPIQQWADRPYDGSQIYIFVLD